jgi:hypothetical protein
MRQYIDTKATLRSLLGLWVGVGNGFSIGYAYLRYALPICAGLKV